MRERRLDMTLRMRELRDVARELLPQRQRRRVLQVRTSDLDDVRKFLGFLRKGRSQRD
jgi:hypothetical protein